MGEERSTRRRARGAHACVALTVLCCAPARAHGPTEIFQVVSSEPDDVVLATSRGLVFGTFAPRTWSLACSEGFELPSGEHYQVARLSSGRLLLAARTGGLRYSDDRACTWRALPALAGRTVSFLAQHPHDREHLYVVVEHEGQSTLQLSRNGGATFDAHYTLPEAAIVRSLLVLGASRERAELYLSATVGPSYAPAGHFIARSRNGADAWERFDIELADGELDLTLLAADRDGALIARASARQPSRGERLLFSRDGGATFETWGSLRILRAGAFFMDGVAYAAGVDGVVRIDLGTGATDAARGAWMHLVERRADALFVAGYHAGIELQWNGLAWLDAEADVFAPFMSFYEVREQIRCPDVAREQRCAPLLADFVGEHPAPSSLPIHVPPPRLLDASTRPAADAGHSAPGDRWRDGADAGSAAEIKDEVDAATLDAALPSDENQEPDAASVPISAGSPRERREDGCSLPAHESKSSAWLMVALLALLRPRRKPKPHRAPCLRVSAPKGTFEDTA